MARKITPAAPAVTPENCDFRPQFKEVRDWDNAGQLTGYQVLSEDRKVQLGTCARDLGATDPKSGKPIVTWTAIVGGKGTGFPRKTVTRHSRAAATMAALKGAYVAN